MKPRPFLSVIAATLVATLSHGATITVNNIMAPSPTNTITNSTGTRLISTASVVGVGYFASLSDVQLGSLSPITFGQVASDFQVFGTTSPLEVPFSVAGTYQFDSIAPILTGSPFIGKNIYTLIGNASSYAASTEFLIYKHSGLFGEDSPTFSAIANVNRAEEIASGVDQTKLLWGSFGVFSHDIGDLNGATPSYSTAAAPVVPEPSISLLGLLGLACTIMRRRRP